MLKLPLIFRPEKESNFVRLGRNNDGGYIVPVDAAKDSNLLLSFGLDDDWSFEKDFYEINHNQIIVCDASVNFNYWIKKFIKNIVNIFRFKITLSKFVKDLITFFKFYSFFLKKEKTHLKKFLVSEKFLMDSIDKNQRITLRELIEKKQSQRILVKIDIEGNEYRVLDELIEFQEYFTSLVIEFHNCDLFYEKIEKFVKNFKLDLVHIHVNNFGDIRKDNFPTVIEMTFSKNIYNKNRKDNFEFPNKKLDQPNDPNKKDLEVKFI